MCIMLVQSLNNQLSFKLKHRTHLCPVVQLKLFNTAYNVPKLAVSV